MKNPPTWVKKLLPAWLKRDFKNVELRMQYNASIGRNVNIGWSSLDYIGRYVKFSDDVLFTGSSIGDFSYIADHSCVDAGRPSENFVP